MLDPRIFELVETLDRTGLDWLSQDVIAGIFAGNVEQETQEALAAVRLAISNGKAELLDSAPPDVRTASRLEMSGDDQVEFAANLVSQRLRQIVTMMSKSIYRLDRIIEGPDASLAQRRVSARLILADADEDRIATAESLSAAMEIVGDIEAALTNWRTASNPGRTL